MHYLNLPGKNVTGSYLTTQGLTRLNVRLGLNTGSSVTKLVSYRIVCILYISTKCIYIYIYIYRTIPYIFFLLVQYKEISNYYKVVIGKTLQNIPYLRNAQL